MGLFQFLRSMNVIHVYTILVLIAYVYLARYGRLPAVESIRKFTSMLDDRGGNILVLGLLTAWFFVVTVKLFYHAITMISNNAIKADDAILLMALNTVSSSAFGTCFGALLKTMSGALTVAPPNATTAGGLSIHNGGADGQAGDASTKSAPKAADGA